MYKKCIFCLFFPLMISVSIYATAQYPDKIIYNGIEYDLFVNPLEAYLSINPDKRPRSNLISSALWRGYIATFEIVNSELYLKDIKISTGDMQKTEWVSVLPEFLDGQPNLKIDWFSGLLVIPHGKLINYVHMGYASTYENYLLLEMENGNFIRENKMHYIEYVRYRERQYEAFKKTQEYLNLLKEIDAETPNELDYFIKIYESDYTTIILEMK